jgi:hypothetical protein
VVGALVAAVFTPLTYHMFLSGFPITEGGKFTAPGAVALRAMAHLFVNGFSVLPPKVGRYVAAFAILTVLNNLGIDYFTTKHKQTRRETSRYSKILAFFPNSISVAIGGYIAPSFAINAAIGYSIVVVWRYFSPRSCRVFKDTAGSGLIAGEGIAATLSALVAVMGVTPPRQLALSFGK